MEVTVIPRAEEINNIEGKAAVIVDVLRATSSMVTALASGAGGIIPFLTPEGALEYYRRQNGNHLLCGERNGVKIAGFHLGNSPLEYDRKTVAGKTLLMTTTNGTRAINGCRGAAKVLIACALNAPAVAEKLLVLNKPVAIVCAGTKGEFSLDDFAVAGLVVKLLGDREKIVMDDLTMAALMLAESDSIKTLLSRSLHGQRLVELGFGRDIDYCSAVGRINLVPQFDGKVINAGEAASSSATCD